MGVSDRPAARKAAGVAKPTYYPNYRLSCVSWCGWGCQLTWQRVSNKEGWQLIRVVRWDDLPWRPGAQVVSDDEVEMKIPMNADPTAGPAALAEATGRLKRFPHLAAVLLSTRYEGTDKVREPGTLGVYPSALGFKVVLKDPTTCSQLLVQVTEWDDVEKALEAILAGATPPWQPDTYAAQKRKGRR